MQTEQAFQKSSREFAKGNHTVGNLTDFKARWMRRGSIMLGPITACSGHAPDYRNENSRHRASGSFQSPAFRVCHAKGLSLSRMPSGSDENHASSSPGGGRTRPYSAIFAAGISHR